jgi:hypothetical protein
MKESGGITEIRLRRTPCYGTCPVYSVTIHGDGRFEYHGERYVGRLGSHTGRVHPWALKRLAQFLREVGFMDFEDAYASPATDGATVYTTVVLDGARKEVRHYANAGPAALWAVEELVDLLLCKAEWDEEADPAS